MNVPIFPLDWRARTYVMGIINMTVDSFSGDGLLDREDTLKAALKQAHQFISEGAHILDIGGESTRPGAQPISAEEEMARVIPLIKSLAEENCGIPISIDTYKASVAEAALEAGAHWINDIWGLHADPALGAVAAQYHAPLILMHNRSKPAYAELQQKLGGRYVGIQYNNLINDVKSELMESVHLAHQANVPDHLIMLDPGIGFGKTVQQNLDLINRLDEICALGYPVLLGPSRKSFIGYTLNLPPEERVEGTAASVVVGIMRGAKIIRVHDVKVMCRIAAMTDALIRPRDLT
jgi:dihydropteroate synthase